MTEQGDQLSGVNHVFLPGKLSASVGSNSSQWLGHYQLKLQLHESLALSYMGNLRAKACLE